MSLPTFFVVGAQKSGTTSLHAYLSQHPDIYLPKTKETKFFADDRRYLKGIDYYQQQWFSDVPEGALVGEVDPDYMYFDNALSRIESDLGLEDKKFIFVLREPVSRAFSHYLMSYRRGLEHDSFEEALTQESSRISQGYFERLHFSYSERGFYLQQLEKYTQKIPMERIHIILAEELSNDTQAVMSGIYQFLGVEDLSGKLEFGKQHIATVPKNIGLTRFMRSKSGVKEFVKACIPFPTLRLKLREMITQWNQTEKFELELSEVTKESLREMYRDQNVQLARMIGKDLSSWY